MSINGYKFTALTGGGVGALDAKDGGLLGEGDIAIVMVANTLYLYELHASSGASESSPTVIAPDTNPGTKRWHLQQIPVTNSIPAGAIVAFTPGYFTNNANGGYASVAAAGGASAATINAVINSGNWYVCDGSALNDAGSSIFNGAGRYLPNLTDSRFLMGSTSAGEVGGSNSNSHTHSVDIPAFYCTGTTLTSNQIPPHTHPLSFDFGDGGGASLQHYLDNGYRVSAIIATANSTTNSAHDHVVNPPAADTGAPTATENRPAFLSCFYIMKAK